MTLLSIFGLFVFLKIILWGFGILDNRLSKYDKILLKKRKNVIKYFIPKNTKNIFVFISNAIKFTSITLFLIIYLPLLLSFLPWTIGITEILYGYIMQPIRYIFFGFVDFLPHLFFIIIIFYVTRYIVRIVRDLADDISHEKISIAGFPKDWSKPTEKLISLALYAFGLIMIFPHLPGSSSPAFKGVSIFLGVLFSFGSSSAISNLIAGLVITYMRPFELGDRVKITDTTGDVIEKTMLVTRIRTIKNIEVTIPNATVINNHMINYSANARKGAIILHTEITIGYHIQWEVVNKLLLKAARRTRLLQRNPKPFVLQKSLMDYYVTYELNVYTKQANKMAQIYSDIHKNILEEFDTAGVEILSPRYDALRDGNSSTVPSNKGKDIRNPIEKLTDKVSGASQKTSTTHNSPKNVGNS